MKIKPGLTHSIKWLRSATLVGALALVWLLTPAGAGFAHGHLLYPKSRSGEHVRGDSKNWPIAGAPKNLRREPCIGLPANRTFTEVEPGPLTLRLLFADGANHTGSCTAYLYDPFKPENRIRISETTECARSVKRGPGQKGQDVPGTMEVDIPSKLPCDPNHCVLHWDWLATHMSRTNIERFEHYDDCADLKIIGGEQVDMAELLLPVVAVEDASDTPDIFPPGWTLVAEASALYFQSIKQETVVETGRFTGLAGAIDADGNARVEVALESVDSGTDLQDIRMRFLLFETFSFPAATISARLDPADLADLPQLHRKLVTIPFSLDLHGVTRSLTADVLVTSMTDDKVAVSTSVPISIGANDFDMGGGIENLMATSGFAIVPAALVTFDLVFSRNETGAAPAVAAAGETAETAAVEEEAAAVESASAAPEVVFDIDACAWRLGIMSRSGSVAFLAGSSRLDPQSTPFLDTVVDVISHCPGMRVEVGAYTDSDGDADANLRLTRSQAQAVASFLFQNGIEQSRIESVGYGETNPVAPNDTSANKARNRRIVFTVIDG